MRPQESKTQNAAGFFLSQRLLWEKKKKKRKGEKGGVEFLAEICEADA